MKTVRLNGMTYYCPLSDRFRRHDAGERERMDDSGPIEYPVLLYDDTELNLRACVLDGEGRIEAAARAGLDVQFRHVGRLTTDQAYDRAIRLNDARRHDDHDAIRRRREDRIRRVAELRADGQSLRAIAAEVGVSKSQVERDIEEASSTVPGGTVEPTDGKVTGLDGRVRTATPSDYRVNDDEPTEPDAPEAEPYAPEESSGAAGEFTPEHNHAGPQTRPAWFQPGSKADPDHPYADLLQAVVSLASRISQAVNDSEADSKLRTYLLNVGFVYPRAKIVGERRYGWQCVGLRGLYRVIRLAGKPGKPKPRDAVRKAYAEAANPTEGDEE